MRLIGVIATSLWLSACTATPMFPAAVTKDVEANTSDVKAWEQQTYQPSDAKFAPHKVELAGQIIKVIRTPDRIVILAEEQPLEARPTSDQTNIERENAPWFAITFRGTVEPKMLQTGNRLVAVGTTSQASAEMLGGAPRMLPHLRAQCLHIWYSQVGKNKYFCDSGFIQEYPPEERTICLEEKTAGSSSLGSQDAGKNGSGGS